MREQRDMTGALFRKREKIKDTHADFEGSITINGQDYWLNGWTKEGPKGKFLSLSAKPKVKRQEAFEDNKADDRIPF